MCIVKNQELIIILKPFACNTSVVNLKYFRGNLKNVYSDNVLKIPEESPRHRGNTLRRQRAHAETKCFGGLELQQSRS